MGEYACRYCGEEFRTRDGYERHRLVAHPVGDTGDIEDSREVDDTRMVEDRGSVRDARTMGRTGDVEGSP